MDEPRVRFAVSTYSYWHFREPRYPVGSVIESAARLGVDGVELLHVQFEDDTPSTLNRYKRQAFANGLDLVMLSIHQDFVWPDPDERKKHIEHTRHCIDVASQLGVPAIRLNSGRWGTLKTFDELMAARGEEPPLDGYTEQDALGWCVSSIEQCVPYAERAGVLLALENHWGLTTRPDNLLRIRDAVGSPWLGVNLDVGNFPGDPYEGIERLAPHADFVQAKTYHGGGEWYSLDLDYPRIARTLKAAGYNGYVSLEMEGREAPETAVPKSLDTLRAAFA